MAGSSMKDIKLRIKSVESTMQITKAMQLVATSKLRRAKERMENSQPYAAVAGQALEAAIAHCESENVPYVTPRPVKRCCYVVIAGERGLAGGYNSNVFKAVAADMGDTSCCVLPLGRKAIEKYHHLGVELLSNAYSRVEGMSVGQCYQLAKLLTRGYQAGQFDQVKLAYTTFHSMLDQEARVENLLPLPPMKEGGSSPGAVYEPSVEEMLEQVVPDFLAGKLYSALCDSFASEVAARRGAMDSATRNAQDMIGSLTLKYNRARQGAITQEITEIVAGAEE
ncbi:MAG: ATP synthase F1 subunit gamma [Candidatus Limiplasma sp.]|nr:ATP synthase F1 subunit gamma [Clostridiales bacterium]MDY3816090.1 ATP synthase F1 subunit gamma [Candidatus Limiplasma sp.]